MEYPCNVPSMLQHFPALLDPVLKKCPGFTTHSNSPCFLHPVDLLNVPGFAIWWYSNVSVLWLLYILYSASALSRGLSPHDCYFLSFLKSVPVLLRTHNFYRYASGNAILQDDRVIILQDPLSFFLAFPLTTYTAIWWYIYMVTGGPVGN